MYCNLCGTGDMGLCLPPATAIHEKAIRGTKKMNPLTVNPEYKKLIPPLDNEEYKALENDIVEKKEAIEPITVNQNDVILDGHNRYEICVKHGCFYKTEVKEFDSLEDEMLYVIDSNLLRRQLTKFQVVELNLKKADILLKKQARQQHEATIPIEGQKGFQPVLSRNQEHIHVDEEIAKQSGVSTSTVHQIRKILEEGKPEEIQEARSKKRMINKVANKIKKRQNLEEAHKRGSPPMPKEVYDIIYADPAWKYDSEASQRGKADIHYATMTTKNIADLEVPSADNAMLFLWVTNAHLEDGLRVLKAWGFNYITNFVWVKDKIGLGWFARGQHELLLLCRKGKMPHPEDHNRYSTVINAPRGEHSVKPEIVYEMIETMYPNRKYLELFSRKQREGWVMWGLEAN